MWLRKQCSLWKMHFLVWQGNVHWNHIYTLINSVVNNLWIKDLYINTLCYKTTQVLENTGYEKSTLSTVYMHFVSASCKFFKYDVESWEMWLVIFKKYELCPFIQLHQLINLDSWQCCSLTFCSQSWADYNWFHTTLQKLQNLMSDAAVY